MDLQEFKRHHVRESLGITDGFDKIHAFVDFGNVNHWYSDDRQASDGRVLDVSERLEIDLKLLKRFADLFAEDVRFYYGHNAESPGSLGFIRVARDVFGKHRVSTKQVQKIRHYLSETEAVVNTRETHTDQTGTFIYLPKCNFDVEIAVDAIKLSEKYGTFCLFSSDADFVHLARYLKSRGKKVILIKSGHIVHQWRAVADLTVNAQQIKGHIGVVKQKPGR